VGLIEDDDVVGGQERPASRQVRAVEGGVDDDDVGLLGTGLGGLGEAG
jgi:hypothetical protein